MRMVFTLILLHNFCASAGFDQARDLRAELDAFVDSSVEDWAWRLGATTGAERPDFDDRAWQRVELGFTWLPHDSEGWFRKRIRVPESVNGMPIDGRQLRLKVSVDNGAKAYVDGVFKQEFEWAKGDYVLTDKAQPGAEILVALHAINRPGTGSLLRAEFVCTETEEMAEGLRSLLENIDYALDDSRQVPTQEAEHWRALTDEAMRVLDLDAFRNGQKEAFLASVRRAQDRLLTGGAHLETDLARTGQAVAALNARIESAKGNGAMMDYARLDARVAESFLQYVRDDWADPLVMRKVRALKGAAYIARLMDDALASTTFGSDVPRYRTGPTSIHDGAFWQNGRPVYFVGVGHFGQVRQDIPILNAYGLNIIQIETGPAAAMPDPKTVDMEPVKKDIVAALDKAAANNVAVNLLIATHYFPEWAYDIEPEHRNCGLPSAFIKYCIEAPSTREIMERWLDALMPLVAKHPALHSICLSNEPQYKGRCKYDRAKFQQWLEARHRTIGRVNRFYGTHFRRFEDVELPKDPSNYALFFDWCRFNQERFLAFHEMLTAKIHLYNPDLPVHVKVMSHGFEEPGRFEVGIDYERFSQLGQISGNDCGYFYNAHHKADYMSEWTNMAMSYALQQAAAPDNPVFNSENHFIPDGDTRYMSEDYIYTVYWHEALHGQGATTAWVWERGQSGDLAENILTRANAVHGLGRAALDLNRLAPEVLAINRAKADMAIFYAYSSLLPSTDYVTEAKAAYEGAYFTDAPCAFVTERGVEAGVLGKYKLVLLPHAANAPDSVVEAFQRYIENGGTVMAIGECFTHDEYRRLRKTALHTAGTGRLVSYPSPLSPHAYRDILDGLLSETQCERPVRIEGAHGEPVWGVNVRAVTEGDRTLVSLLNLSWETVCVTFKNAKGLRPMTDLVSGQEVQLPVTLTPLRPMLLTHGN